MATSKVHPALKAVEKSGAQKVKVAVSDSTHQILFQSWKRQMDVVYHS